MQFDRQKKCFLVQEEYRPNVENIVNNPSSLAALVSSPSYFLEELGVGRSIFLLRLSGSGESGVVPLATIEENIRQYGPADLAVPVRKWLAILRVENWQKERLYCVKLRLDYSTGTFDFGMCRKNQEDSFWLSTQVMWQKGYKLTLVPLGFFPDLCP